jgi:hypothetical protein
MQQINIRNQQSMNAIKKEKKKERVYNINNNNNKCFKKKKIFNATKFHHTKKNERND